jgi:hypothetical protein
MVAECWPTVEGGEAVRQGDEAEAAILTRSAAAWERLQERIAHRFFQPPALMHRPFTAL